MIMQDAVFEIHVVSVLIIEFFSKIEFQRELRREFVLQQYSRRAPVKVNVNHTIKLYL